MSNLVVLSRPDGSGTTTRFSASGVTIRAGTLFHKKRDYDRWTENPFSVP